MSKVHHILIVDDHKEIRTTFRANLEALEANINVIDVPSGEEAILEATGDKIDLIIADVGLPGLSGLELLEKVKDRNPETRVILVTGLEDEDIRRQVADAGTEAFFIKPVRIPELLKSVQRALGLKEEIPQESDREPLGVDLLSDEVSERIADLRGELGAISIVLLRENGTIAAKSGGLPDAVYESHVMPELLDTFQSVNAISSFLNASQPRSQWYFSGEKYDLFWTHTGPSYGLLVVMNPILQNTDLTWVMTTIDLAVRETLKLIQKGGAGVATDQPADSDSEEDGHRGEKEDPVIEEESRVESHSTELFGVELGVEKSEADSFWESASLDEEALDNPDALTYEEARKLGFIPEENSEGA